MTKLLFALVVCLSAAPPCRAATDPVVSAPVRTASTPASPPALDPARESSSVPSRVDHATTSSVARGTGSERSAQRLPIKPFSTLAVQLKVGLEGAGIDLAMPVASRLNVRIGGSFVSYNPHLVEDGMILTGEITMQSIGGSLDFYPFGNAFRVSPGLVFYNGNRIQAFANVPGGQSFTLNDQNFLSDPADPINGAFGLTFGKRYAPSLTIGVGNMIPRHGGHWSTPFEIGAEYVGQPPVVTLALYGSACQQSTDPAYCQSVVGDPATAQNVAAEQAQMNASVPQQLRFFPIVSFGVSYRIGRTRRE